MTTKIIYHPDIFLHDAAAAHVTMSSNRIAQITQAVIAVPGTQPEMAVPATLEQVTRNHHPDFVQMLISRAPQPDQPAYMIDRETIMNEHTLRAMLLSAGAACQGVDAVLDQRAVNVFCPVYAGHHAEERHAAGFCFINSIAIAAKHALARGVKRLAILDIDVHSGNGTALSFLRQEPPLLASARADGEVTVPPVLFAETYQTGYPNSFLPGYCPSHIIRRRAGAAYQFFDGWAEMLPVVAAHEPELLLVSAGFDAHAADPLGTMRLLDRDYTRIAREILAVSPRVVACLEGGYDVPATSRCAALFVAEMVAAGAR